MPGGEMTKALLVRHPAPFATESFFGYILRLSEENGYTTPWSLFLLAGMTQHETRTTGIKVAKLAQVANRSPAELEPLSYRWGGDSPRSCRLLGHLLRPHQLVVTRPKLCPECVAEKGFIEAHFDLALMTGCAVHRKLLISSCPRCMKPLRWFRPGLLECRCGSLLSAEVPSIGLAEADLLDIVRRKILGLASATGYASGLPYSHLQLMSLRSLLSLVAILGKRSLTVENDSERKNPQRVVLAAANVLADWPSNFFRLLRAIAEGLPQNSSSGVSRGPISWNIHLIIQAEVDYAARTQRFSENCIPGVHHESLGRRQCRQEADEATKDSRVRAVHIANSIRSTIWHSQHDRGPSSEGSGGAVTELPMWQLRTQGN
jgi:hypothetical protein